MRAEIADCVLILEKKENSHLKINKMLHSSIIGNLGADAKLVEGASFKRFVSLSVSHNEKFKNALGVDVERTYWVNVIINWNCEKLMPYLLRGSKIYAEGETRLRAFTNGEGKPQASIDIIANTIQLCGGNRGENASEASENTNQDNPF